MQKTCKKCPCNSNKTKFKPVTHVIFDLDGIIVDTEAIYKDAFIKTLVDYGIKPDHELYATVCGTTSNNLAETTLKKYDSLDATREQFVKKYRQYSKVGLKNLKLIPGVEKMIRHLHVNKIPLAVATSSAKESALQKLEKYPDIYKLFNHVVFGNDPEVKLGKPNPDAYLVCASRFPANPSKCLVFEDSSNGMEAAISAGMQVILIPNETVTEKAKEMATLKVDCFDDVKPELFGLPAIKK